MNRIRFVAALVVIAAPTAAAQGAMNRPSGVTRPVAVDSAARSVGSMAMLYPGPTAVRSPRWPAFNSPNARRLAPLASAILPGSGQFLLGEDRSLVYAAIEAGFWLRRINHESDRRSQERLFRRYAREVARPGFPASFVGPEGDWAYYEQMRGPYLESGAFSLELGRLVPETDTLTFNGVIWLRAREHNPDAASALAEYMVRAVPEDMRWSWRDAQLQWDLFKRATEQRNTAAGRAAFDLIVIGANHVISMVDAFTTIRLQVEPSRSGGRGFEIAGSIPWRRRP